MTNILRFAGFEHGKPERRNGKAEKRIGWAYNGGCGIAVAEDAGQIE